MWDTHHYLVSFFLDWAFGLLWIGVAAAFFSYLEPAAADVAHSLLEMSMVSGILSLLLFCISGWLRKHVPDPDRDRQDD